jgi:hypothetical protein
MEIGMFTPGVPVLLEFHKRVQEKKDTCNVRRFDRPLVDVARISPLPINYFELGHYLNLKEKDAIYEIHPYF